MHTRTLGTTVMVAVLLLMPVTAGATLPPPIKITARETHVDEKPRIVVRVPVPDGVENPEGWVRIEVMRSRGGYHEQAKRYWSGEPVRLSVDRVKRPGKYLVRVLFDTDHEAMRDQDNARTFRVTR